MAESKSKYGALIRKAREPENHKSGLPDSQITIEPDDQKTINTDRQKSGKPDGQKESEISEQIAVKPDNQITINPDDQITRKPEKEVNLCVKVPESLRRHWAAESKRHGVTMTEVMIQALSDRFGRPD